MTTDDERIDAIFLAALEKPVRERAAYVESEARDDAKLADMVKRLLVHADALPDDFMKGAVDETPTTGGLGTEHSEERFSHWKIIREIGRGGQATVYEAFDDRLGRRVALKIFRTGLFDFGDQRQRFRREAAVAARLEHKNICPVYEADVVDDTPFIAMPYVDGKALSEMPIPSTREEVVETLRRFEKIARALHAAHEAGIVHRDIKSANIMLRADGEPLVMDFGIAKDAAASIELTGTGDLLGTPSYMSPEQIENIRHVDRRTDVWSLGVCLYERLVGKRPFEAPTRDGLYRAILSDDPAPFTSSSAFSSRDLAICLATALEKDLMRRYRTAELFADDLARIIDDRPILARPAGFLDRLIRIRRRHPIATLIVSLTISALSVGIVTTLLALAESKRQSSIAATRLVDLRKERDLASRRESQASIQAAYAMIGVHDLAGVRRRLEAIPEKDRGFEWRLVASAAERAVFRTTLPAVPVRIERFGDRAAVVFLEDGRRLVCEMNGGDWHVAAKEGIEPKTSPTTVRSAGGHFDVKSELAEGVSFSVEGNWASSVDEGRSVVVIDRNDDSGRVDIDLLDARNGASFRKFTYEIDRWWTIQCADIDHRRSRLAIGSGPGMIRFVDCREPGAGVDVHGFAMPVVALTFSADGRYAFGATVGKEFAVFDCGDMRFPGFVGHELMFGAEFDAAGRRLCYMRWGCVSLFDIELGRESWTLNLGRFIDAKIAFSPDDRTLVVAAGDGKFYVIDATTGRLASPAIDIPGAPRSVLFIGDRRCLLGFEDRGLFVVDLAESSPRTKKCESVAAAYAMALDRKGNVAVGDRDGTVAILSQADLSLSARFAAVKGPVTAVAFDRNSDRVFAADAECRAVVLDSRDPTVKVTVPTSLRTMNRAEFLPDGSRVAVATEDSIVAFYDPTTGDETFRLTGSLWPVFRIVGESLLISDQIAVLRTYATANPRRATLTDRQYAVRERRADVVGRMGLWRTRRVSDDVAAEIAADPRFSDDERSEMLSIVRAVGDDANRLNGLAWNWVRDRRLVDLHAVALRQSLTACRIYPDNPGFLNTLAWCYVRNRMFDDSVATVARCHRLREAGGRPRHPSDLACEVLAECGRGRIDLAEAAFVLLAVAMKDAEFASDAENQTAFDEAREALSRTKKE